MTKKEKIDMIWQLKVLHTRVKKILKSIEECHQSYFRKGESVNLFISGDTGLGKTTICDEYVSRFPMKQDGKGTFLPVLYVRTPTSPTMKSLTTKLLDAFNDPAAFTGTFLEQRLRLRNMIRACGTQLVILDELQHMIDPEKKRILHNASNFLKELIDELEVPTIGVGLSTSEPVLISNLQLGRRISQREELTPFKWSEKGDQKEFRRLLMTIDAQLPLKKTSELATEEMAHRIYHATGGVMDHIMKLVRHSAQVAVEKDMDHIDSELLSHVYEKHISSLYPEKFNPFNPKNFDKHLLISPQKYVASGDKAYGNRIKHKPAKETVSSVLRTR